MQTLKKNPCSGFRHFCTRQSTREMWIVKELAAVQETRVQSLVQEDLLENEMATSSSVLAWKNFCTAESGGLWPTGSQRVRHDWVTNTHSMSKWGKWAKIHKENSPPLLKEIWLLSKVHSFHTPISSTSCKPWVLLKAESILEEITYTWSALRCLIG